MRRFAVFLLAVFSAVLISSELSLSLPIFGVGPDVLMIVVVAFAAGERRTNAATYGFVAGFVRDLLLSSPKGISAFAYAITAYSVALVGDVRSVWPLIGMISGATFVSQVFYGAAAYVLGGVTIASLPRVGMATTVYNTLLAPLLMPLVRRFLQPAKAPA